jgi:nucleoid-associated protein YgaU
VALGVIALGAAAGAGWYVLHGANTSPPQPVAAVVAPAAPRVVPAAPAAPVSAPAPVVAAAPAAAPAPSFDIVRVSPAGDAVLAGRAAPGAEVSVTSDGKEIGRTTADSAGQWVLVPGAALPAGGHELRLSSQSGDGAKQDAEAPVVVMRAEPAPAPKPSAAAVPAVPTPIAPLAVLVPPSGPVRVLQGPATPAGKLGLDTVDYDDTGRIRFAGAAPAGSKARVYVDDKLVGEATVDAAGHWALLPGTAIAPGDHKLRLDQLGANGQVVARVELPFTRATVAPQEVANGRVVVQPRQNLWRIARQAYGQGVQYTVIYAANRDQIRDPNLIYPGQVFALPAGVAPASATKSR